MFGPFSWLVSFLRITRENPAVSIFHLSLRPVSSPLISARHFAFPISAMSCTVRRSRRWARFASYPAENYIFKDHHGTPLRACLTMPHSSCKTTQQKSSNPSSRDSIWSCDLFKKISRRTPSCRDEFRFSLLQSFTEHKPVTDALILKHI